MKKIILSFIFGSIFLCMCFGTSRQEPSLNCNNSSDSSGAGGIIPGMGWDTTTKILNIQKAKNSVRLFKITDKIYTVNNKKVMIK